MFGGGSGGGGSGGSGGQRSGDDSFGLFVGYSLIIASGLALVYKVMRHCHTFIVQLVVTAMDTIQSEDGGGCTTPV